MTQFSKLNQTRQIKFILGLQHKVGNAFRNEFKHGIISSQQAKHIMDNIIWNNTHLDLEQLTNEVLNETTAYINNKLYSQDKLL